VEVETDVVDVNDEKDIAVDNAVFALVLDGGKGLNLSFVMLADEMMRYDGTETNGRHDESQIRFG
jgi:hypothetical protein